MSQIPDSQFRHALTQLAEQGALWLASSTGQAFMRVLARRYGVSVRARARRLGYPMDIEEVVNMIVLQLLDDQGRACRAVAAAADPFAYLGGCVKSWAAGQWCLRAIDIESGTHAIVADAAADDGLTPLEDVIAQTVRLLAPLTPAPLTAHLDEPVQWLALNPPQRLSYEGQDVAAASERFTRFSPTQIAALARICWGSRPRQAETSIFGGYLVNEAFNPAASPTHAVALSAYRRDMRDTRSVIERLLCELRTN